MIEDIQIREWFYGLLSLNRWRQNRGLSLRSRKKKISSEILKGGEKMAKCASCGKEIKKKTFWRKGKPYCSPECADKETEKQ